MFVERGRRNKRPGRQGATGKQSKQKASPGEDVTIMLTKVCRQDSMFFASSFAAKGLVCLCIKLCCKGPALFSPWTLTAQIPFHAYEHRVPKPGISCTFFFWVQFLEMAAIHCQQQFTALLVWWNTVFFFILLLDSKSFFSQMMGAILSCVSHPFWLLLMAVISVCTWNLVRWESACCYM